VRLQPKTPTGVEIAERVQAILETRNLTLYQVSQKSAAAYGAGSSYVLPHNLYYDLRLGAFSPNLYQVFALSKFSGYRLADWLHVLGFDLEEIPRLQLVLPSNRTVLLDVSVTDPNAWIPWFRNRPNGTPSVAPLTQLLEVGPPVRQGSLLESDRQHFLYAKIGLQDVLAFPDLLPGSIVRVNPRLAGCLPCAKRMPANELFLVEHGKGLCCCRLRTVGKNRILLVSAHLPYAQVELQLNREARVLGVVDIEIRPVIRVQQPEVAKGLASHWKAAPLARGDLTLSQLLRAARARTALSLREASGLSRQIASALDDERYFMSPSSLSDYEARDTPPRHLHKIITLCLLYAVPFHTFLNTVGLPAEKAGQARIPDRFMPRPAPTEFHDRNQRDERQRTGFLEELMDQCQEIPVFLRRGLDHICALASPSPRSFFWIGGIRTPLHPYLANGLLVSVDRHKKRPVDSRWRPVWEQSLYVVLKRDGTYLCGPCGIENSTLVIHPDSEHSGSREIFRNRRDAEIVGQITAIARRLV
jgi:transcriptional regulator with XRE-family HTH domain